MTAARNASSPGNATGEFRLKGKDKGYRSAVVTEIMRNFMSSFGNPFVTNG